MSADKTIKSIKKEHILKWSLIGILSGITVIKPFTLSLFTYDAHNDKGSWFSLLINEYKSIFLISDWHDLIITGIFGLSGGTILISIILIRSLMNKVKKLNHINEAISLINSGENSSVEFKSTLRWDLRMEKRNSEIEMAVLKTIAAFINTNGGNLFIGIDDNGESLGLEDDYKTLKKQNSDGFEQFIMTLITTKVGANYCTLITTKFYKIKGKEICRIKVKPYTSPAYIKENKHTRVFIRTGNGTRELNIQESLDYIKHQQKKGLWD
tara:strand:- start:1596 stop:2399 length:804 start_codon:yes stop_codon:yes gene_type:complete